METSIVYLASPYSHKDVAVKEHRYELACKAAATLMERGDVVFCPIAHSHPIETIGMTTVRDELFWLHQDFAILSKCTYLAVLCIDGWKESSGVRKEIEFAESMNMPVYYLTPQELGIKE